MIQESERRAGAWTPATPIASARQAVGMPEPTRDELREQLRQAEARLFEAEAHAALLDAELRRTREWRKAALMAVVAVAVVAILMLGLVAFNAVD